MMETQTVSFVPLSPLVDTFIPDEWQDEFYEYIGQGFSWGDNFYTLVGNKQLFSYFVEFCKMDMQEPMTEEAKEMFWNMVGYENFINLED